MKSLASVAYVHTLTDTSSPWNPTHFNVRMLMECLASSAVQLWHFLFTRRLIDKPVSQFSSRSQSKNNMRMRCIGQSKRPIRAYQFSNLPKRASASHHAFLLEHTCK